MGCSLHGLVFVMLFEPAELVQYNDKRSLFCDYVHVPTKKCILSKRPMVGRQKICINTVLSVDWSNYIKTYLADNLYKLQGFSIGRRSVDDRSTTSTCGVGRRSADHRPTH